MARKFHYIYIPGLGDKYDWLRSFGTWHWQLRPGVTRTVVPMRWGADEPLEHKHQRVIDAISDTQSDVHIILVGESAGGSVALTIPGLTDRKLAIVTFCGKNTSVATIGQFYRRRFPSFVRSVELSEQIVNSSHEQPNPVLVCYSENDRVVVPADGVVSGADTITITIPGHLTAIMWLMVMRFRSIHGWVTTHTS